MDLRYNALERFVELRIVQTHTYHSLAFLLGKRQEAVVVVSLVGAAYDPHHRPCLTFESIPRCIHVCRLGVVDVEYILDAQHFLEAMLDCLECRESVSDDFVVDVHSLGCDCRRHRVIYIVLSSESQLLKVHITFVLLVADDHPVVLHECPLLHFLLLRERKLLCLHNDLVEVPDGDLVVRAEDKAVVIRHIAGDAELRLDIVLHLVVVPVQMVRRDVGDYGYVGLEVIYVVQLEAAELQYIDVVLFCRYLIGVALSDVAAESYIKAGLHQKVIDQRCGSGLSVASGDAYLLRSVISPCEFDLRDDVDAAVGYLLHHRSLRRYSRALHHLVRIEDEVFRMLSLLVRDLPLVEHSCVFLRYLTHIGEEYIITFNLREHCGTYSALASTKYY